MNLLEKYYLQGKGKLMVGIFVLVVLLIISTIAFTGCFSSGKKSDDKNTVTVFNYGDYIDVSVLKTFEKETGIKVNTKNMSPQKICIQNINQVSLTTMSSVHPTTW